MNIEIKATIDYDYEKAKFFLAEFEVKRTEPQFDKRSKSGSKANVPMLVNEQEAQSARG